MRRTLVVFLVASLSLLLPLMASAAGGVNVTVGVRNPQQIHLAVGKSTLIDSADDLRQTRTAGFARAMDDMSENLVIELNKFEFRIEEDPSVAQVGSGADLRNGATAPYRGQRHQRRPLLAHRGCPVRASLHHRHG